MSLKVKYYYFFRGTLATHVHFYKGWVDAARKRGLPVEMVTILSLRTWLDQRHLVKKYEAVDYFHILLALGGLFGHVLTFFFFAWACLCNDKVVVHLKKRSPGSFDFLKRLFPNKLRYIIELEGDFEAEKEYLLEHPYKAGFYDNFINDAKRQAVDLKAMIANSDHVFVVAPALKQLLIGRYPQLGLDSKISVIATGVDCERRFFSEELRTDFRKALGLEDKFVMIFIGNAYYSWQNVFRTIEIFKLVRNRLVRNAFLVLLIRQQDHCIVQEFIEELALAPDEYLLKQVPAEEITRYLNAADLGLLLRHEHLMNRVAAPGKFGEYVACGLPVMMTNGISNFSDMISDTDYAIVLDDMDDDNEIVVKIEPFLPCDNDKRAQISDWARRNVSIEAQADVYVETLRRTAGYD